MAISRHIIDSIIFAILSMRTRKLMLIACCWSLILNFAAGQTCIISGPTCLSINDKNVQFSVSSPTGGTWSINPISVATISNNGRVSGVSQGTATISYVKGSCTAILPITVLDPGTITKQRNSSGKCSVWLDGSPVTCIDGSTPTYQWWYSPTGQDNYQMVTVNGTNEDLYANVADASKYKYKREVTCGGCTVVVELNSPVSSSMILSPTSTNVTCYGASDGTALANVTGGNLPLTYQWGNGTTTQAVTNLAPGSYTIRVEDYYGCSTSSSVTITGPINPLAASISSSNVICYGSATGSITVSASGGWGGYSYSKDGTTYQTINIFSNLTAGIYTIRVKDANNCIVTTSSTTITQPEVLTSSIISSVNVACYGGSTGSATASVIGGTAPYSYNWNTTPVQTTNIANNLAASTYNVTVTDTKNCSATSQVTITQPSAPLTITMQPLPQTDCYGNHVEFSVSVSGVVGTATYQWQQKPPSGTFSDITGANSALLSIDNIGMYGQNVDGTEYRVIITDDCRTITSNSALLHVNSITGVTPATGTSTICDGGGISYTVTTSGIVTGYQWSFDNGSGYTALSDGGAYSGVTSAQLTISNATATQSGGYRVSVTFETLNQPVGYPTCIETSSSRPRNLIVRAPSAAPVISSSQQVCYNTAPSALTATASTGGSGPYSYQWQNSPDGTSWTDINGETTLSYAPPALMATTYYRILATDEGPPSCGFVYSTPVKITVNSLPIPGLTSSDADNLICTGDAVTFTASGGTSYNFRVNGTSVQNSASATYYTTGLTNAQTVDVVVTNAAGCNATSTGITTTVSPYPDPNPIVTN